MISGVPLPAARMLGLGTFRPEHTVSNVVLAERLDLSPEWIESRTGIAGRRRAEDSETVVDMGIQAARQAIARAGVEPADIDCVIAATISFTDQTPSAAVRIAAELDLGRPAAFDVSAACAGFTYGLDLARCMIAGGTARHVLVVGVERMTDLVDPTDPNTAILFSDGAGAVVVGPSATPGIGPIVWGADGRKADLVAQNRSWADFRDNGGPRPYLRMQGQDLFMWVIEQIPAFAYRALELSGVELADLDAFIPHQANARMTECLCRALELPDSVAVADDIRHQGNASAASIPLAMATLLEENPHLHGGTALLAGFGAGLAFGAQVITLPAR
ncbi:beta-ketoacyl-ACP synthase 3 [Nocardia sp. NPDC005825]|uniref:beta-ketoacyl-ACP synthase 3 n=1 Tax=unclassified Nocardia TaxID=2637762 RepID=UPI0033C997E9